jgi:flagellar motor protein MotB
MAKNPWQDDPDLAAMRPRRSTPWGRIFVGIILVGCGTFGLAYYLPLFRAHHALIDDHARLRHDLESAEEKLQTKERELKTVTARRDELEAAAHDQEAKAAGQASELGGVKDALAAAVDKFQKKKLAAVAVDASGARVALSPAILFANGKLDVTPAGATLLCAVAKAAGARTLRVTGVAKDAEVPAALKAKLPNAWTYTTAAAAAVATTLSEKCAVSGAKLYAEGSDGSRPTAPSLAAASPPAPRLEVLIANADTK